MKQLILPPPTGLKAEYGAPQSRIIQLSVKTPILTVSPIPGAPGYYNDDDDIIIPDVF